MKRFEFDAYEALRRAREGRTLPIRPTSPIPQGRKRAGIGRIGRIGATDGKTEKIIDAVNHFEERAAIREYDGKQTRSEAEAAALFEAVNAAGVEVVQLSMAIAARKRGKA